MQINFLDRELYGNLFNMFLDYMGFNNYGTFEIDKIGGNFQQKVKKHLDELGDYEDNVFSIKPFCWCDVCDGESDGKCPRKGKPNFHYKPTNFQLSWYKYPLRSNSCNKEITAEEFIRIINNCIASFYR